MLYQRKEHQKIMIITHSVRSDHLSFSCHVSFFWTAIFLTSFTRDINRQMSRKVRTDQTSEKNDKIFNKKDKFFKKFPHLCQWQGATGTASTE